MKILSKREILEHFIKKSKFFLHFLKTKILAQITKIFYTLSRQKF